MKKSILIDTDIVIDFLRGRNQAVSHFKENSEFICFSSITVAEIYAGIKGREEEIAVEHLFSIFPIIETTHKIAIEAGKLVKKYRPSHSVELPDAIIAASCIISESELNTLNIKHYPMFRGLKPPYRKQDKFAK